MIGYSPSFMCQVCVRFIFQTAQACAGCSANVKWEKINMKLKFGRRAFIAAATAIGLVGPVTAGGHQVLESIHFLIPGGAGGGWDGTARGTGEALTQAGLVGSASYENMSGGGGGKAIGYLIENADSQHGTLMVNSTPIVIRSLTGVFPHNFRDLTLVAGTIGDYAAMVVGADSDINNMADLVAAYDADPSGTAIGGGSVPGGMDHLVAAMVMEAAGKDALNVKYIPYDAGGKAMAALLSGEIKALSTGFSEAVALAQAGEVKIIGVTSDERVAAMDSAMTMKEQGIDTSFVNWRGFFAAPGLPADKLAMYQDAIAKMYETPEWEAVRARNGWVNIHNSGDDFMTFLESQEKVIGDLMKKLGFL
jgi:putative tricarboxylic transport membrane protein